MKRSKSFSSGEPKETLLSSKRFLDAPLMRGQPDDPSPDFETLVPQLLEREQRARLMAETLLQATAAINSTLELNQVLDLILAQLQQVIVLDSASLMLLEDDLLQILAVCGHPNPEAALEVTFSPKENQLAWEIIQNKKPVVLADAQLDQRFSRYGDAEYVRGWMGIPLIARGQVIGLLTIDSCTVDTYSEEDARLGQAFASQAALAVMNARLYESERAQRSLAQALREVSLVLSSTLKAEEVLAAILEGLEEVVAYDSARVLLVEDDQARAVIHRGYERYQLVKPIEELIFTVDHMPNLRKMMSTLKPCVVSNVQTDPEWVITGLSKQFGSWLGAPLVAHGRLLGFLSLEKVEPGYYGPRHGERLEILAGHVALALLNALTYGEMERASVTDFLTGAYNHRYFQQQLRRELELAQRINYPVSLLMLDIDYFKDVNDSHGHLSGDRVLQLLAGRLRIELRNTDHLARYGGEEFAVILPGTPELAAHEVAERLRRAVASTPFLVDEGLEGGGQPGKAVIPLTISIGVSTLTDQLTAPRDLVAAADRALYKAKDAGRNCVR